MSQEISFDNDPVVDLIFVKLGKSLKKLKGYQNINQALKSLFICINSYCYCSVSDLQPFLPLLFSIMPCLDEETLLLS